jgi:hypothetical protein
MSENQNNQADKKATRKAYWAGARTGFVMGFKEGVCDTTLLICKASIVTSTVLITILAIHKFSGGKVIPSFPAQA